MFVIEKEKGGCANLPSNRIGKNSEKSYEWGRYRNGVGIFDEGEIGKTTIKARLED